MEVIITFGQIHAHRVNNQTFDKDCVAVIKCNDHSHGRKLAFELFGDKWYQCVPREDWYDTWMMYYPRGYIEAN